MNTTHTYVELDLSPAAYEEIAAKLRAAGYDQAFDYEGRIDLHGLAAVKAAPNPENPVVARQRKEFDDFLKSMPNWHGRHTDDLAGWINELATLADGFNPRHSSGTPRDAMKTIWRGMRDSMLRALGSGNGV